LLRKKLKKKEKRLNKLPKKEVKPLPKKMAKKLNKNTIHVLPS
jgi:hypothetical protein